MVAASLCTDVNTSVHTAVFVAPYSPQLPPSAASPISSQPVHLGELSQFSKFHKALL